MEHKHKEGTLINKEGYGCIYSITNKINGMQYIGQTSREYISNRWSQHKVNARNNVKMIIYDAMREYGIDNFEFTVILFDVPIEDLWEKEIEYIKKMNTLSPNGYNTTQGGGGTLGFEPWDKGITRSEETKRKISEAYTEERKKRFSERMSGENSPMYGKHHKGISRPGELNPFYGKKHTQETKDKMSVYQTKNKKRVAMLDIKTNEVIKIFDSLSQASKYMRVNGYEKADDSAIGKCAKGIYKNVYNHKWIFIGG